MYRDHPTFIKPDDENIKIWRYLDLTKFLSILDKKALYFSRLDQLGDRFEGSIPSTEGQDYLESYRQRFNLGPQQRGLTYPEYMRKTAYVCSFHMNSFESAALWSIYTKAKLGVAIQSTYKRLCDAFSEYAENDVFIGTVKYIDYSTERISLAENITPPLVHKRKSFEYERELRAMILFPKQYIVETNDTKEFLESVEKHPLGIYVPVNLDILIENIYIAPTTPSWIKDLMTTLLGKFRIDKDIHQSDLDKEPII